MKIIMDDSRVFSTFLMEWSFKAALSIKESLVLVLVYYPSLFQMELFSRLANRLFLPFINEKEFACGFWGTWNIPELRRKKN